jgi:beta-carotene/zeaxanthin 4-ketolase
VSPFAHPYQAIPIRQLFFCFNRAIANRLTPHVGILIALLILFTWAISFSLAFRTGAQAIGLVGCALLIPWFSFLYTGLFVTGHDAMHSSIAPGRPRLNRAIGQLALLLYGLIPYEKLYKSHAEHHRFPASHGDPDFHDGRHTHPVLWYLRFMRSYWTLSQTVGIVISYNGLHRVMGVPEANLLVFWAIPALLSSVQLFYFGTYLVHRRLANTYSTPLCANSFYWPTLISLITCYHFSRHREHHAFPEVPWWQLPKVSRAEVLDQVNWLVRYPPETKRICSVQPPADGLTNWTGVTLGPLRRR